MTSEPFSVQVCVDCADPHVLADWWAELLGWPVEPSDEAFIRRMVEEGQAAEADTTTHRGVLVWRDGVAIRHPAGGPGSRILFQRVPEAKAGKNRVHLDVNIGAERVEAELARATATGATLLHRGHQGPYSWVTIQDPEGNELCLQG
jgi:hypothetical protein